MLNNVFSQSKQNAVMNDTWGKLRVESLVKHSGYILFTYGEYGDVVVIKDGFDTIEGNPWYYQNLMAFISFESDTLEQGFVYKFKGTYEELENGTGIFSGDIETINL